VTWTAPDRPELLDRMAADVLDVLVVGAGITGAGIALDAAARGYRVGVVERDDVASGTSSKSSKLVHGGLRYLATGDAAMVRQGVRERERLRRVAPHLVRPLGFVVPTDTRAEAAMLRAGLLAYDAMAAGRGARRHRALRQQHVLMDAPGLARGARHGGIRYDDAQTDDARLTLAVLQAARRHGAIAVTHADVTAVEPGTPRGAPATVHVRDRLAGGDLAVRARWVVGAGGVRADRIGDVPAGTHAPPLRPARGVHVTLRRVDVPVNRAVVVPSARDDGRRLFVVPWGEQVYVGTTDDPDEDVAAGPRVSAADAAYLLDAVNAAFATDLAPADAVGAWAGWRPLVDADGRTADLSRRHLVHRPAPGVVTITGGKLTTYRQMAEDVVDVIVEGDGLRRRTRTTRIPLGATGSAPTGLARARGALEAAGADPRHAGSLYHRHGDRAPEVVASCAADGELDALVPGLPYLVGEVRWAARHEMACTLDDVLSRRLRVSVRDAAAGGPAIDTAATIMAQELGWDRATRNARVAAYRRAVEDERGVVPLRG
jgi:glycerol-3-phosphate dehydrogenase